MIRKRSVCTVLALLMLLSWGMTANVSAQAKSDSVLAHWKLQNNHAYCTGNIDTDELVFTDLSGNGNHLLVGVEGKGAELDIFKWDKGVNRRTLKNSDSRTSLLFDNSLDKAQSVDSYDPAQTAYSGAYVSGKYLHTAQNAPLNSFNGKGGWTVEVIFKVSPDWSNIYNRYTGIFSKQGVVKTANEPAFSLAMSDGSNLEGDKQLLGSTGRVGLQYLFVDAQGGKTNEELVGGFIKAGVWCHYMVTNSGGTTKVYLNGQEIKSTSHPDELFVVDKSFGWEVGVGRKLKGNEASMNEEHPEGLIRRLFCGSISEIRFSSGVVDVDDSLMYASEEPLPASTSTKPKVTSASTAKGNTATTAKGLSVTVQADATAVATQGASVTTLAADGAVTTVGTGTTSVAADTNVTTPSDSSTTTTPAEKDDNNLATGGIWIAIIAVVAVGILVAVLWLIVLRKKTKK